MNNQKKYLDAVIDLLKLYQQELLIYMKIQGNATQEFKKNFNINLSQIKKIQINKSIDYKVSQVCSQMSQFCQSYQRMNKTSVATQRIQLRNNLRSQGGNRFQFNKLRATAPISHSLEPIDLQQISKSYKLKQQATPAMRMKWKSGKQQNDKNNHKNQNNQQKGEHTTIDNNNIDLLAYTIPDLQSSINRLTLTRNFKLRKQQHEKQKTSPKKENYYMDFGSDNKSWKKKFHISRLF